MLTIWDSKNSVPNSHLQVYTWDGYVESGNIKSLFKYIDANDKILRSEYLSWVYELGEFEIEGVRLKDHYLINEDFSFWWMTLFVEKSPWTQPSIIDAIRIFAINKILKDRKLDKLLLVSSNIQLNTILQNLCESSAIKYEWQKEDADTYKVKYSFHKKIPLFFQSIIAILKYYLNRKPLKKVVDFNWSNNKSIFFCSYFFNLESSNIDKGIFYSKQWESLPSSIKELLPTQNWLHIFHPHTLIPNTKKAADIAAIFNKSIDINGSHKFVDSFLTFRVLCKVFLRYFKLYWITLKVKKEIQIPFSPRGFDFSLWPIMKNDFYRSLVGPLAINNLFYFELFDIALSKLPKQKIGLFLYENLSWESAFLHFWKKHGHGKIYAVAHSTVRFWDLRYFYDKRVINSTDKIKFPQADYIALNGQNALESFIEAGYPVEKLKECEALRYLHFHESLYKLKIRQNCEVLKILILGDYMSSGTNVMLAKIEKAVTIIPNCIKIEFTIKPHSNFQPSINNFPLLKLNIVNEQLYTILSDFDIAISSNMTSASVDACLGGLPVIIFLEESELNFSPLRGDENAFFVSTSEDVSQAILNIFKNKSNIEKRLKNFFFLDPKLPRWKEIIAHQF